MLRQVEKAAFWMLMRVGYGSTAHNEVGVFLDEFATMTAVWERNEKSPCDYRFFTSG